MPLYKVTLFTRCGRGDWIRTSDFYVPNVALYQAEPRPVSRKEIA
jgi:hypothetical protein